MNISFKGIDNFKAESRPNQYKCRINAVGISLNNGDNPDSDEFRKVAKDFLNPDSHDILVIHHIDPNDSKLHFNFALNQKPLLINDENLPVLEKLSYFLSRIEKNVKIIVGPSKTCAEEALGLITELHIISDVKTELTKAVEKFLK